MSLLELFCDVDDFMLDFEPHWKASQLQAGGKQRERAGHPFDLVFGRKTYEIFAAYWPCQNIDENPSAASLNVAKKYVASHTLLSLNWSNSTLLSGDVVQEITRLKQQDGPELQVHGSANLIQTLLSHDLVDELWKPT